MLLFPLKLLLTFYGYQRSIFQLYFANKKLFLNFLRRNSHFFLSNIIFAYIDKFSPKKIKFTKDPSSKGISNQPCMDKTFRYLCEWV
jgi:hypothetical protein